MEEKYCTNCNAEFMMMESFNFCGPLGPYFELF